MTEQKLDWDEFGSIHRPKFYTHPDGFEKDLNYVDLREFDGCHVIPIGLPANLHFYWNEDKSGINSHAFVVQSRKFKSVYDIHCYLVRPGIHYVLYAVYHDAVIQLRWHTIEADTVQYRHALVEMMSVTERLRSGRDHLVDLERFPHVCPRCLSPAYVGLADVDCSRGCQ